MKNKAIILIGIGIFVLIGFLFFNKFVGNIIKEDSLYDNFAQCLTDKGIKVYGTDWCSYCKKQKGLFGDSFKFVNYVDCDYNKDKCNLEGIQGYPTWKINDESYPGVQQLERLSQISGCEL